MAGCEARLQVLRSAYTVSVMHDPKVEAYLTAVAGWSIRQTAWEEVAEALRQIERAALLAHKQSLRLLACGDTFGCRTAITSTYTRSGRGPTSRFRTALEKARHAT
jgi:hypothetical protein